MRFEELLGKVVIVTGGNSGIGNAIAREFAAQDCKVIVGDIGEQASSTMPQEILYKRTDVSSQEDIGQLVELAVSSHGRVDILVNCAGVNGPYVPVAEQADTAFSDIFDVNVKGVFLGMKYCLPLMVGQKSGTIINIASIQGVRPIYPGASLYAASKAAVVSLTRSAALEYGQYGIRVVAIAPGPIDTPMLRKSDPEGKIIDEVPLHRIGSPGDIANTAAWLSSDLAAYVSGTLITVDGAFLAA